MTDDDWHLDKKVPIALVVLILLQTATAGWYASALQARVTQLESVVMSRAAHSERITRNEARVDTITTWMMRIDAKLDRVIERIEP